MQGKMRTSPGCSEKCQVSASNACEQVLGETLSELILSGSDAGIVWCLLACRLPACSSFF
jgi:hypothetical protein